MNAAIYLRVSTRQQDEETQLPDLLEKIKEDKTTLIENYIFSDKISGTKNETEREGLVKLLQLTKADIDIIYIWEVSRLSRDPEYFDELIIHFKRKGINLCFLKPIALYLFDLKTGEEILANTIALKLFSTFALWEIKQKAQRTQRGKRERIKNGICNKDTKPLYGYYNKDGKTYIKDEKNLSNIEGFRSEKEVVESIFQLYNEGKTPMYIKNLLDELHIPPRNATYGNKKEISYKGAVFQKKELKWSKTTIRQMLCNPKYYGKGSYTIKFDTGKKEIINGKSHPIYREEVYEVSRPAIISETTFLQAQQKMKSGKPTAKVTYNKEYLLRGLIKCGYCGDYYTTSNTRGEGIYKCADRDKKRASSSIWKQCKNGSIYREKADSIIWNFIKKFYIQYKQKELKTTGIESFKKEINNKEQIILVKEKEISQINKQEYEIGQKIAQIPSNLMEGFLAQAENIANKKSRLTHEIDIIKKEIVTIKTQIQNIESVANGEIQIADIDNNFHLKEEAIRKLIKEVLFFSINSKTTLLQVTLNTINPTTNDYDKVNLVYLIWQRTVAYLPDNLYHFNKQEKLFSIKLMPQNQLNNISLAIQTKKIPITELIELIPKENWVKVNRIPQKIEYDYNKQKRMKKQKSNYQK